MSVGNSLQLAQITSPAELAESVRALARAFLHGNLANPEREEARLVLTGLLDHSSPLVRRTLAESFASAANVPHYMVLTLANDSSDVAAIVLARSPLFSNADLVECAATADAAGQMAIALRPWVPAPVAAALAEVGARKALISLSGNPGAELLEFSIRRMIERYGHDPALRAALLARPNLPAPSRSDLAVAAAQALLGMMTRRAGMTPERARCLTRDATEKANVKIAAETASEAKEMVGFVAHLRRSGQLTAGLLLRGLLCGNKHLLETALCELSGVAMPRVMGLVAESKSAGFAALYRKAHMPERLLPAFVAGLDAIAQSGRSGPMNARLQRPIVASVLHACASVNRGELDQLIAALHRLEAEAARDEAREFRRDKAASHAVPDAASAGRLPPPARKPVSPPEIIGPEKHGAPAKGKGFSIVLAAFGEERAAA
ncbi:MAG TPA: DUF2336 domain-containing protein [Methylocella sp.]|jgi:uncharacterized protein (DUF2336 family)